MRRTYRRRPQKTTGPQYRYNESILAREVRLIDERGGNVGVVSTDEARRLAAAADLDLVEIAPQANPPVAKILDYSQFKYQKDKEVQKQKAKQKKQEVKGVRLSLRIGKHDEEVRLAQAQRFLNDGDKLKVELILRGRENQHRDLATTVITKFVDQLRGTHKLTIEQPVQKQGNRLSLVCFSAGKVLVAAAVK